MEETRLTTVPTGLEAEMICGRLRLEGIRCYYGMTDVGAGAWTGGMALASGPREVISVPRIWSGRGSCSSQATARDEVTAR